MPADPTHYEVLDVAPGATASEIRAAYRRAAREHHPDVRGNDPIAATRMAQINHAWTVVGHPARRAEYDRTLRADASRAPASGSSSGFSSPGWSAPASAEPRYNPLARYQDPPRFPWRFLGVLGVLGVGVVALGVLTGPDAVPAKVDNVLQVGDCVAIESNGDASERLCTAAHDGVVTAFAATLDVGQVACAAGTEAHRDSQGLGVACIRLG